MTPEQRLAVDFLVESVKAMGSTPERVQFLGGPADANDVLSAVVVITTRPSKMVTTVRSLSSLVELAIRKSTEMEPGSMSRCLVEVVPLDPQNQGRDN